ncbi:deoxyguanosinetriphosphate triphosphohydrolase [Sulfuriferula multivorans]|uniref:Deoxyguanosinetriphosphate triphosphohydrolase n=2 Tax=Sulfuriferula multivorans TaxID=1559896 RepID=A0A401JH90_9PROT|nr:deoxyguanosinetriphosphate triphosphohydrolase [Sulfuriferula multivorans]
MTHSLEVAHVGIYIVEMVFKLLKNNSLTELNVKQWRSLDEEHRNAICTFVETACLVHDLGNPPFGHFGEKAIRSWFNSNKEKTWFKTATSVPRSKRDFLHFDGNMQGFRILTRLQRNLNDPYGLNLTATQLATAIKYPKFNPKKPEKCGFFESEAAIKKEIWAKLGLDDESRHPCSLLMEAADDVAYCVSDLEDASEKGLLTEMDLSQAFNKNKFSVDNGDITRARTDFTNRIVQKAAESFIDRLQNSKHCATPPLLEAYADLDRQKKVSRERVYSSRLVLANEVTGFAVIPGLLDHFIRLFEMKERDFRILAETYVKRESFYVGDVSKVAANYTEELGLLSLLSRKHLSVYIETVKDDKNKFPEMFHRLHLILDLIAGMTDHYALDTYRLVSGQVLYGHRH